MVHCVYCLCWKWSHENEVTGMGRMEKELFRHTSTAGSLSWSSNRSFSLGYHGRKIWSKHVVQRVFMLRCTVCKPTQWSAGSRCPFVSNDIRSHQNQRDVFDALSTTLGRTGRPTPAPGVSYCVVMHGFKKKQSPTIMRRLRLKCKTRRWRTFTMVVLGISWIRVRWMQDLASLWPPYVMGGGIKLIFFAFKKSLEKVRNNRVGFFMG